VESFHSFANELREDARAYALNLTRDSQEAERLVQASLASAYGKVQLQRFTGNLPWIKSLVYRSMLETVRVENTPPNTLMKADERISIGK
jgi:DNA-directed RNA polymerase specialized sigma24 family protein